MTRYSEIALILPGLRSRSSSWTPENRRSRQAQSDKRECWYRRPSGTALGSAHLRPGIIAVPSPAELTSACFSISRAISSSPLRSVSSIAMSSQRADNAPASTKRKTPEGAISATNPSQTRPPASLMLVGLSGTPLVYCGSLAGNGRREGLPFRMRIAVGFGGGPLSPMIKMCSRQ
jgi:hypothetical protein